MADRFHGFLTHMTLAKAKTTLGLQMADVTGKREGRKAIVDNQQFGKLKQCKKLCEKIFALAVKRKTEFNDINRFQEIALAKLSKLEAKLKEYQLESLSEHLPLPSTPTIIIAERINRIKDCLQTKMKKMVQ